ncbi:MFS transporter [Mycobacterium kansasii]|uniref:Multidrug export protein EmrB n=1 Tax=Mycobacterium attenuatum TaxID=2341086 RepID=A0A498Q0C1_9MYCO|nr:DHA2 family efflux MFS transporter permease subunit [Mycobacterium attenuatum]ORB86664.1 MFS transporter [Mycobacterium kansasii]VBA38697.1 Multidrug export protein EmrB [Mycobacterium attenuatum]VBA52908.1 Multidrug export protein EmrB [Mycobacterium attenuatum]
MDDTSTDQRSHTDQLDPRLLRIAGVCVLGAMMSIVDTTVVTVAQRTFVATFHTTQAMVAWTMTGYTLALAAVIPLAGWVADRFGTKRPFIGSLLAFTFGSLLCAMAPNITLLVAFRVVQGLGGGMLMPLVLTILTREAGPQRLGRVLAILGIPMLLGPIFGPVLGGWLIDSYGWEWIFWINLPIGLITVALAMTVFPPDQPAASETFDVIGMLLLSPGLATFLYGVSQVPRCGTVADRRVWIPVAVGLVLITGFVVHALLRSDHPLLDLRLFSNRTVRLANVAMFLFAASFFGAGLLFPSYFQELLHQRPLQAGMSMVPRGIGAMVTMPLAGTLMDKRGPRSILLVGIALIAAGMGVFAYGVAVQADYLPTLLTGLTIMGLGMGATMMPLSAVAVQTLAPHQIARGSTLINVNQQVAASVGTAFMSVLLTSQFNRSTAISRAHHIASAPADAAGSGVLAHDLSHAYSVVFAVAVALVALMFIPVALLPKRQAPVG